MQEKSTSEAQSWLNRLKDIAADSLICRASLEPTFSQETQGLAGDAMLDGPKIAASGNLVGRYTCYHPRDVVDGIRRADRSYSLCLLGVVAHCSEERSCRLCIRWSNRGIRLDRRIHRAGGLVEIMG